MTSISAVSLLLELLRALWPQRIFSWVRDSTGVSEYTVLLLASGLRSGTLLPLLVLVPNQYF